MPRLFRDLKHQDEVIPYAFGWDPSESNQVLGTRPPDTERTLNLLLENGDLLTYEDPAHRLTRLVETPEGRKHLIVMRDCRDRLKAQAVGRARRFEAAEERRASERERALLW
ncbi:MAG: hypothetical protein H0W30_16075 [Gemmatimonadaceae bacterium]|nr:hypothetical protein [Gemmatimonadaceae bacterium]